jgi:hypothetical protein
MSVKKFKFDPRSILHKFIRYNHVRRLRLEKLLRLELPRSPNGFFKALMDPGDRFASETVARKFQKRKGRYETVSEVK